MCWIRMAIIVAVVPACLIALGRASDVLVDWLWFASIGHVEVFWTIIATEATLFLTILAASAGALSLSGRQRSTTPSGTALGHGARRAGRKLKPATISCLGALASI
jgi:uncharacterized protein